MDWNGVRMFLALARTGRLSTAARQLGVEHTTVSRRLAGLEEDLGTPLFYRTVGGYRLTAAGESTRPAAEAMERAARQLGASARERTGIVEGQVRLALVPEFASHWLAPQLPLFRSLHPRIELQVLVGTRQLDLSRGEAELACAPAPAADRTGRDETGAHEPRTLCFESSRGALSDRSCRPGHRRRRPPARLHGAVPPAAGRRVARADACACSHRPAHQQHRAAARGG